MPLRLAVLVLLELVGCVFFAVRLAGADPAAPPTSTTSDEPARTSLATSAPVEASAGTATNAPPAPSGSTVERIAPTAKYRADDPVGVLLTGTVRFRDGAPVAEPSVSARRGDGSRGARAAANGCFALAGLSPGTWTVSVRADGASDIEEDLEIGDDAEQRHDFVLDRSYPVRVLCVTLDGKDLQRTAWEAGVHLPNVQVVAQRDPLPERIAPTDYGVAYAGDAKFDAEMNSKDGFVGTLHLTSAPPAHAALLLRHVVVQRQRIEAGQQEVKFVVDLDAAKALLGTASLRLLDEASGAPLDGVVVQFGTSSGSGPMGRMTDAEGRITFTNVHPGLLFVTTHHPKYESLHSTVRVEPGQTLDLGDLRLGPTNALAGRLVDEDGKPASANVSWTELKWRSTPRAFVTNRSTRVEADGSFSLWGTGRGRIAVQARTQDGRVAVSVFDNPSPEPVVLRLVRGAKVSVVRSADPTKAYTITFFDGARDPVDARTLHSRWPRADITLPPGTWSFEVHDETDRLVQSGSLTLGASPTTLEIR